MSRVFLAALAALSLVAGSAAAEPTATEQRIRELAAKKPGSSVVFMDVRLLENGRETTCSQTSVDVVSDQGYSDSFFSRNAPGFLGRPGADATYGGITVLPAGTYTVVSVRCKSLIRLNGKFARFRVGANEIINAGCLVIDFKVGPLTLFDRPTFNGRTNVEGLETKAVQSLTGRAPTIFPKAAKRYLTPNPATSGPKPS